MARVLVIGDTHCPAMDLGYPNFLEEMAQQWETDTVVHIGDVVDWASISYHEKLPGFDGPAVEYQKALDQVQLLYKKFQNVTVMTGNHDDLPRRQMTTVGLPEECLVDYNYLWQTPYWDWKPRFSSHVIDGVIYRHGDSGRGGKYAALNNAMDNFNSYVQGHTHSLAGVNYYRNEGGRVFGMNVGCGVDHSQLALYYARRYNAKPILGCGIVLDGKYAYWEPYNGIEG